MPSVKFLQCFHPMSKISHNHSPQMNVLYLGRQFIARLPLQNVKQCNTVRSDDESNPRGRRISSQSHKKRVLFIIFFNHPIHTPKNVCMNDEKMLAFSNNLG